MNEGVSTNLSLGHERTKSGTLSYRCRRSTTGRETLRSSTCARTHFNPSRLSRHPSLHETTTNNPSAIESKEGKRENRTHKRHNCPHHNPLLARRQSCCNPSLPPYSHILHTNRANEPCRGIRSPRLPLRALRNRSSPTGVSPTPACSQRSRGWGKDFRRCEFEKKVSEVLSQEREEERTLGRGNALR